MFGAQGSLGRAPVDSSQVDYTYASVRGGLAWMATPSISIGPFVGAGGAWEFADKIGTSPLLEGGALLSADVGPVWIGLEGGVRGLATPEWTAAPAGALTVGATFR